MKVLSPPLLLNLEAELGASTCAKRRSMCNVLGSFLLLLGSSSKIDNLLVLSPTISRSSSSEFDVRLFPDICLAVDTSRTLCEGRFKFCPIVATFSTARPLPFDDVFGGSTQLSLPVDFALAPSSFLLSIDWLRVLLSLSDSFKSPLIEP